MKTNWRQTLAMTVLLTAAGCSNGMPIEFGKVRENWPVVGIGQEKSLVLHLLGEPDAVERVSVLGVERERLIWTSRLPNRRYEIDMVLGRVMTKTSRSEPLFGLGSE